MSYKFKQNGKIFNVNKNLILQVKVKVLLCTTCSIENVRLILFGCL